MPVATPGISRWMKIGGSALLALAALGLFWVSRTSLTESSRRTPQEITPEIASALDREVDSVLARCNIERGWIRKSRVMSEAAGPAIIERKVAIPMDVLPVHVNVALNVMARRFNAKVIAYENIKENTVALNIEFEGRVLQRIVLKQSNALQRRNNNNASPNT